MLHMGLGWLSKYPMTKIYTIPFQLLSSQDYLGAIPIINKGNIFSYLYRLAEHWEG
jgi:hypothetical protein